MGLNLPPGSKSPAAKSTADFSPLLLVSTRSNFVNALVGIGVDRLEWKKCVSSDESSANDTESTFLTRLLSMVGRQSLVALDGECNFVNTRGFSTT